MVKTRASKKLIIYIVLLLLLFTVPLYFDKFIIFLLTLSLIATIFVWGMHVLFGLTGQISVGQGAFYGIGAYIAAYLVLNLNLSFFLAIPIAVILTSLLAYVIGFPLLRLKGHYLALGTLSLALITYTVLMRWVAFTGGPSGFRIPATTFLGIEMGRIGFYYLTLFLTLLSLYLIKTLSDSYLGRAFMAIRDDEDAASSMGIDVFKGKMLAFIMGAALSSLAGILYVFSNKYIAPDLFNIHASVQLLFVVVVGGLGSATGAAFGAVLFTVLPQIMSVFEKYEMLLFGILVFVVIIFLPRGLVSLPAVLVDTFRKKKE